MDALEAISGKWRIPIIISLTYGNKRFGEIHRDITGISPKMLAKELHALEQSKLVNRTVFDSKPVTIEYELTALGNTLKDMLDEVHKWGEYYRSVILGNA